eukprot:TRINITY_DN11720_c0_g1_i1.p1 TRINITY_DN11720_c0_g1~~TRINITY_DN11720_c0_g1_i1.p1  ORF type:complete len:311 (-),score=68.46 TRINITY_DN11720_c0_g1_i1:39-890(-)
MASIMVSLPEAPSKEATKSVEVSPAVSQCSTAAPPSPLQLDDEEIDGGCSDDCQRPPCRDRRSRPPTPERRGRRRRGARSPSREDEDADALRSNVTSDAAFGCNAVVRASSNFDVFRYPSGARGVRRTIPSRHRTSGCFATRFQRMSNKGSQQDSTESDSEYSEDCSQTDIAGWCWFEYPGYNDGVWIRDNSCPIDDHLAGMEEADEAEEDARPKRQNRGAWDAFFSERADSVNMHKKSLLRDEDGDLADEFWVENCKTGVMERSQKTMPAFQPAAKRARNLP